MFSADLPVWFYCVQVYGFLGASENSRKIHRKSTHYKVPCARSGARGGSKGPQAPCWRPPPLAAPGGLLVGSHTPGALPGPLFLPVARKFQNRNSFSDLHRGAAATLCSSSGKLIWRLFWPPMRGNHRHRHHHRPSITPP